MIRPLGRILNSMVPPRARNRSWSARKLVPAVQDGALETARVAHVGEIGIQELDGSLFHRRRGRAWGRPDWSRRWV